MNEKEIIKRAEEARELAYCEPAKRIYEMCEIIPTEDKNIFKLIFIKENINKGRVRIKDLIHFLEKRKLKADIRVPSIPRYNYIVAPHIIEYRVDNNRVYYLTGNYYYYPFTSESDANNAIILDYDKEVHVVDDILKININKCVDCTTNVYLLSACENKGFAIIAASSEKEALCKAQHIEDNKYSFSLPVRLDNVYANMNDGIITYQIYK